MIPAQFTYRRASTLDEAIEMLAESGGEGRLLAGGHSLVPLMKLRLSEPAVLVDIARIPGLRGIREGSGQVEIGATTTHHEVATSEVIRRFAPAVAQAAAKIGDPQVRNRGTIAGSLAHADPAADLPAAMLAVGAELRLKGPAGWRTVKAEEFFQDLFTVDLAPGEVITAVQFGPAPRSAYVKLEQRASGYALVGVAAALDLVSGTIASARVGLTGATSHATRLRSVEAALAGKPANGETIAAASATADAELEDVNADLHASEEYRRAMVRVITARALGALIA